MERQSIDALVAELAGTVTHLNRLVASLRAGGWRVRLDFATPQSADAPGVLRGEITKELR